MGHAKEKNRIKAVNIVFLATILISVITPFVWPSFLTELPWLNLLASQLIILLPSVVYMIIYRLPYKEAVRFRKMKVGDIFLSILFGILIQPAMTLINALSLVFTSNATSEMLVDMSLQMPLLVSLLFVAVLPGVLEETVYRGIFFNEYRKVDIWKGALLSGFLFGLMHGNLNQFCYATVMGIVFGLLIEATGSILSTMLVHFWTNACSTVMIYIYPKLYEVAKEFYNMYIEYGNDTMVKQLETAFGDMTLTGEEWMRQTVVASAQMDLSVMEVLAMYGPVAVMSAVLAYFVYKKLAKRNGNWYRICGNVPEAVGTPEEGGKKRLVTIPLVIAIVIGIAFMIFYEILVKQAA